MEELEFDEQALQQAQDEAALAELLKRKNPAAAKLILDMYHKAPQAGEKKGDISAILAMSKIKKRSDLCRVLAEAGVVFDSPQYQDLSDR